MHEYPDDSPEAFDIDDIPWPVRIILLLVLIAVVLSLSACGSSKRIERVERQPPAAAMVRLDPHLPAQTDPTLGGVYQGYVNGAQQYRYCADLHAELQDWVDSSTCTAK